ncbi:MAG: hypothetical protein LBU66_00710 [Treponema sp.]|jgi:hypothetical protein|nr:hypothetical protein [Treponema sp.]
MKRIFIILLFIPVFAFAESMYSPTWGFYLDLPEGYEYIDGDEKNRFSFSGPADVMFDLVVYNGVYATIKDLVDDVNTKIENKGEVDFFDYRDKQAAIFKLEFGSLSGWGLCVTLAKSELASNQHGGSNVRPMLVALAYGPAGMDELELLHISALDSISPSKDERFYPGPVMEYSFPRGGITPVTLAGGVNAMIRENDAEAAQILIEREFQILQIYANTPSWQAAWIRYYRFIYRDSYDRVTNAASALARHFGGSNLPSHEAKREFAQRALTHVQNFQYERDLRGSDFINMVTSVIEGRGSCDSYSMLWAIILNHASLRAAMMVSRHYSHAMGLADITGAGARFDAYGTRWLVAETTSKVDIGLIAQEQNDPRHWIGIIFE